jgi:hypothetical protein
MYTCAAQTKPRIKQWKIQRWSPTHMAKPRHAGKTAWFGVWVAKLIRTSVHVAGGPPDLDRWVSDVTVYVQSVVATPNIGNAGGSKRAQMHVSHLVYIYIQLVDRIRMWSHGSVAPHGLCIYIYIYIYI